MSSLQAPLGSVDPPCLRLLLVDAHDRSRRSSRVLLDALPGLHVVGETGEHAEALELSARMLPDVVIMSMRVRGGSGAATARALMAQRPGLPVVVLTLFDSPEYVEAALDAGAGAYVLKQSTAQDLVAAIEAVMKGQRYLGAGVALRPADTHAPLSPTAVRRDGKSS